MTRSRPKWHWLTCRRGFRGTGRVPLIGGVGAKRPARAGKKGARERGAPASYCDPPPIGTIQVASPKGSLVSLITSVWAFRLAGRVITAVPRILLRGATLICGGCDLASSMRYSLPSESLTATFSVVSGSVTLSSSILLRTSHLIVTWPLQKLTSSSVTTTSGESAGATSP